MIIETNIQIKAKNRKGVIEALQDALTTLKEFECLDVFCLTNNNSFRRGETDYALTIDSKERDDDGLNSKGD